MSCDDPAQNRGGSRNFAETQQFLEFKSGRPQSGINTFAAMKSRVKKVDSTGRSAPIPSQKAQKRLDEYMALALDANSQELDGRALYTIGRGMKHGRVPIGDGAVDKAIVLAHSKSVSVRPPDPDHYESVLQENAQLKTNNDILAEENRVHRELFKSVFDRIGIEIPAELVQRLQDLDARRHQATGSHGGSHSVDERRSNDNIDDEDDDDDYSYHESNDDDCSYHEGNDHVQYSNEDDDDDHIDDDDDDGCLEDGDDSSSSQSDDDHHSTEQ